MSDALKRIEHVLSPRSDVVKLARALNAIMLELGVPQPGYPMPVANAYEIAERTLEEVAGD